MNVLTIRQLQPEDHAQWRSLWAAYNAFYGRSGATALSDDVIETAWARFFDADEPVHALGAVYESRLLGIAHYVFHRSTIQIASTCYLQDLFTAPESRGCGIATALIDGVCQAARLAGSQRVYWQTRETNAVARRLYDQVAVHSGAVVYHRLL